MDVSDPAAPTLLHENRNVLGDRENGPLRGIYDVKVDGDLLAVTGPANPGPRLRAVVVFDVSDPTAPERVSVHETGFFNHNCDIDDGVVALCGNDFDRNPLVTIDAETGEELGRWSVVEEEPAWGDVPFGPWQLHDVSLSDGVAYVAYWDAGTWLVDVSDPANPTAIAEVRGRPAEEYVDMASDERSEALLQPPGNDHFAAPNDDGSLVAVSAEGWDAGDDEADVRPGSLYLYDTSDPENATELAEIPAPETSDEGYNPPASGPPHTTSTSRATRSSPRGTAAASASTTSPTRARRGSRARTAPPTTRASGRPSTPPRSSSSPRAAASPGAVPTPTPRAPRYTPSRSRTRTRRARRRPTPRRTSPRHRRPPPNRTPPTPSPRRRPRPPNRTPPTPPPRRRRPTRPPRRPRTATRPRTRRPRPPRPASPGSARSRRSPASGSGRGGS
ncbi:LVIVD repeat-containing protein [Halosegnis marinus]|uniref:LVIVD repeat-containing protein n=1 Tax=Halosegnis marinus TaxID=3034023 RepID=UPI003619A33B